MPDRPAVVPPQSPRDLSDAEVGRYIAEMCAELRQLAGRPRFRTVSYLLDMARMEAERAVEEVEPPT